MDPISQAEYTAALAAHQGTRERFAAEERQRFIDDSARRNLAALLSLPVLDTEDWEFEDYPASAFNYAEALWDERQKRLDLEQKEA